MIIGIGRRGNWYEEHAVLNKRQIATCFAPRKYEEHSLTLVFPKQLATGLGVGKGDFLKCYLDGTRLVVEKVNPLCTKIHGYL